MMPVQVWQAVGGQRHLTAVEGSAGFQLALVGAAAAQLPESVGVPLALYWERQAQGELGSDWEGDPKGCLCAALGIDSSDASSVRFWAATPASLSGRVDPALRRVRCCFEPLFPAGSGWQDGRHALSLLAHAATDTTRGNAAALVVMLPVAAGSSAAGPSDAGPPSEGADSASDDGGDDGLAHSPSALPLSPAPAAPAGDASSASAAAFVDGALAGSDTQQDPSGQQPSPAATGVGGAGGGGDAAGPGSGSGGGGVGAAPLSKPSPVPAPPLTARPTPPWPTSTEAQSACLLTWCLADA